jgi:hypothetical protein
LHTDIPIRCNGGRKRALDEHQVRRGVQALEAKWLLGFPRANSKCRRKPRVNIRVPNVDGPARKIRIEVEVEQPCDSTLEDWTNTSKSESVDDVVLRIFYRESLVCLDQETELKAKLPVGRLREETILPASSEWRGRHSLRRWLRGRI